MKKGSVANKPLPDNFLNTPHSRLQLKNKGIYFIKNTKNNKFYIGSATNTFYNRLCLHSSSLEKEKHCNSFLQRSYKKHKGRNFIFTIKEKLNNLSEKDIIAREQYYLDKYKDSKRLYNINMTAGSPYGSKHSEDAKRNRSIASSEDWIVVSPEKEIREISNLMLFSQEKGLCYSVLVSKRDRNKGKNIGSYGWLAYRKNEFNIEQMERDYYRIHVLKETTKEWVLVSPKMEIYHTPNLNKFAKENKKFGISRTGLTKVAEKQNAYCKGWLCYHKEDYNEEQMKIDYKKIHSFKYKLTHEDGRIINCNCMTEFCKEYGGRPNGLIAGSKSGGWKLEYLKDKQKWGRSI